eukprot:COSAG04_NODE_562_length_12576_cov_154.338703_5_plen_301_part_00
MRLTFLCVSAAFSRPVRCCDGALTPSACVLTGRNIQGSYLFGDTAALSVAGCDELRPCLRFTPCSDLGGCGSGTLVASPAMYAGCTQAACCGAAMCAGNPEEDIWRQIPDRVCRTGGRIASFPTEAEARAACLADDSCRTVSDYGCDGSGDFQTCSNIGYESSGSCAYDHGRQQPDFPCRVGSLISAANSTAGYDITTCCDATCAGNLDGSADFSCSPFETVAEANFTQGYDRTACCDTGCAGGTMGDFRTGICVLCPIPSRCADGITCGLNSQGKGCASCKADYFAVVSVRSCVRLSLR